jgi:Phospholipase B
MRERAIVWALVFLCCFSSLAIAEFTPDPASVQRDAPAYRYPQAGWIVLHVEGAPYERGRQQGKLLWREIQNYVKCFALQKSYTSPEDAWALVRTMTDGMFLRRFDPELLEEMKGIADGAADAGAKFNGRPLDLIDIVAINVWPEILTLEGGLHAEPNGLEGKDFDKPSLDTAAPVALARCSAFAATGPATKDGKAIIGHITMFALYPCDFFNVWIDVKPEHGHRLVFQGAPGSVQSGMDWYVNDAGMVLAETTIRQTRFDPTGLSLGSRSRRAMQYGDSIDSVVKILGDGGNGLYTNEWLLADMKTNEIAIFELGTKTSRLMRSSKNQWFGGTTGFYWSNNNVKDLGVRIESLASLNDRPADMTFVPELRDKAWVQLFNENKGKIDANFGRLAFSTPPITTGSSCDAKFTTAEMALHLASFAHWGDAYGQLWEASPDELARFPSIASIVPNDWTTITTAPPPPAVKGAPVAVDLKGGSSAGDDSTASAKSEERSSWRVSPAWHGTILPATDGDIWLASSFATFQNYVVAEKELIKSHAKNDKATTQPSPDGLSQKERDQLAVALFQFRAEVMSDGMADLAVPLREIKTDVADDAWFRSASGRGAMLLSELRQRLGPEKFDAAMDAFGRAHAGKPVDSQTFAAAMIAAGGPGLKPFFSRWLDQSDVLPRLELSSVSSQKKDSGYVVSGRVLSHGGCAPASIDVTIETKDDETTSTVPFVSDAADFHIPCDKTPTRLVVNKYGKTPCLNGWNWNGQSFERDLAHTLIIFGTRAEADGNRIAAEKLREGIIERGWHAAVTIKPDTDVTADDLRGHHLLLIGRPECNDLDNRFASALPVTFGPRSFVARGQLYANAQSAVIAAGDNPFDPHFCVICIAGLGPEATLRAAKLLTEGASAPLKIIAAGAASANIVPPAPELVLEFK